MQRILAALIAFCLAASPAFSAFGANSYWQIQTDGDDTNFGGGFDTGATFPTDGAATVANTSAPVFTSASYNFVAGDVGAWIFIKSGTSWIPGWYKIASVAANAATLDGTIGHAVIFAGVAPAANANGGLLPSTTVGMASVASPTAATWGIDYSQSNAAILSFTDIVIGGTTTQFTSAAHPVGKNFIGNTISVTAGATCTVQRVSVQSTATTTATVDKSLGTAAATCTAKMGGALASLGLSSSLVAAGNSVFIKSGAYTITSTTGGASGGVWNSAVINILLEGFGTVRGDLGTRPTLTASGIATVTLISPPAVGFFVMRNLTLDAASLTAIRGIVGNTDTAAYLLKLANFTNNAWSNSGNESSFVAGEVTGCATVGAAIQGRTNIIGSVVHDNTVTGISITGGSGAGMAAFNLSYNNSGASSDGFALTTGVGTFMNNASYNNGRDGFRAVVGNGVFINNIAETNTGVGFNPNSQNNIQLLNNATFGNGTAIGTFGLHGYNIGSIAGASSFFVNAAGGNFALNNTASAGASMRAAGFPGVYPLANTTGKLDIGAAQHADPTVGAVSPSFVAKFMLDQRLHYADQRRLDSEQSRQKPDYAPLGASIGALIIVGVLMKRSIWK